MNYDQFVKLHQSQLHVSGLPESLWPVLFKKLHPVEVYDGGNYFMLCPQSQGRTREDFGNSRSRNTAKGAFSLHSIDELSKDENVFIVDHFWSSDGGTKAKSQLNEMPLLLQRLQDMFGVPEYSAGSSPNYGDMKNSTEIVQDMCICDASTADNALKVSNGCLIDAILRITNPDLFGKSEQSGETTECSFEEFKIALSHTLGSDLVDSYPISYVNKLYKGFVKSGKGDVSSGVTEIYSWIDDKQDGIIYVSVPIPHKIKKGQIVSMLSSKTWKLDIEGKTLVSGTLSNPIISDESVWTIESPGVMCMALQKQTENETIWNELIEGEHQLSLKEILTKKWSKDVMKMSSVKNVLDTMWYFNAYRLCQYNDNGVVQPIWYVTDEVGSAIMHNTSPNVKCCQFYFTGSRVCYNIMWPVQDIKEDDYVTRDFIPPLADNESMLQTEVRRCIYQYDCVKSDLLSGYVDSSQESDGNQKALCLTEVAFKPVESSTNFGKKLIFSNLMDLDFLSSTNGCLKSTSNPTEADILLLTPFSTVVNLNRTQKVNLLRRQYFVSFVKLCHQVTKRVGMVSWLPRAFDLQSEFCHLCVQHTGPHGNLFFIKSAESWKLHFDPVISSHLLRISRLLELGPVCATRYIPNTLLYNGCKFALSYTVICVGPKPFKIYIHNQPFVRVGKRKFNPLELYDEYDTSSMKTQRGEHVVEHQDKAFFADFILEFESKDKGQANPVKWTSCEMEIREAITSFCSSVVSDLDIDVIDQTFGLFGVDFIVLASKKPVLVDFDLVPTFANKDAFLDVMTLLLSGENHGPLTKCNIVEAVIGKLSN